MWTILKIGVFYGAPIVAVALAVAYFVVLLLRVRRAGLGRSKAALLYAWTLLLPIAVVVTVWGTAELAGYFAAASDGFAWNSSASISFLLSLFPLAGYVGVPIAALNVVFWATLALGRPHA